MEEENISEDCEEEKHSALNYILRCRSIRIGSYKVQPPGCRPYVDVCLTKNNLSFNAPIISNPGKQVHITLGYEDVNTMYIHFGKCLPVIFISTTSNFGKLVRKYLGMIPNKTPFFDPSSKGDLTQKLTFSIECMTIEQTNFVRWLLFAGNFDKIIEIDLKQANEILVRSTSNQVKHTPDMNMKWLECEGEEMEEGEHVASNYRLRCSSIRIGSYKVQPPVDVILNKHSLSFNAPIVSNSSKLVHITLGYEDVNQMSIHFEKCLPVIFISTTSTFGQLVRKHLGMIPNKTPFFDPSSKDDKTQKLTFLIESMTEVPKSFIRWLFFVVDNNKIIQIDLKTANEILVKSTPNKESITKVNICAKPVVKLLTYPAPSVKGCTVITNQDFNCLDKQNWLNDTIIDFYLNYLFNEKLSPYYKERTHIFISFFACCLINISKQPLADNATETLRDRYKQVSNWTRRVNIFSKDFIIIPVNEASHWFLVIICYASRVPDSEDPEEKSMDSSESSPHDVKDSEKCAKNVDSTTNSVGKHIKEMPCICIFNSLSLLNGDRLGTIFREYLELEWKFKNGTKKVFNKNTLPLFVRKCPQQTNSFDCGIYLLQFVESFFEQPIKFYNPMLDLTNWFTEKTTNQKRQQLKDLIRHLQMKQERDITSCINQSSSGNSQHSDNT